MNLLSAKLLLEKIVEPGQVSYPAVLRHNFNLLFQAIRTEGVPAMEKAATGDKPAASGDKPAPPSNGKPAEAAKPTSPAVKLEIKSIGEGTKSNLRAKK